jgi:hypothetical protein
VSFASAASAKKEPPVAVAPKNDEESLKEAAVQVEKVTEKLGEISV